MYSLARAILFKFEAETSHHLVMTGLAVASGSKFLSGLTAAMMGAGNQTRNRRRPIQVMGIEFPNRVGLAAGLDKDAVACNALHRLGFGWLELGTVTPVPQPGQPKPRMFRLPEHDAMINRLGFNSSGLDRFIHNIKKSNPAIIKGINISKNSSTPISGAVHDYLQGLQRVHAYADYVTINISSPNTQNLRDLQQDEMLDTLLYSLNRKRQQLSDSSGKRIPLVLKISPDISGPGVNAIAALLRKHQIDGVCATNTTVSREQDWLTPPCRRSRRPERPAAASPVNRDHFIPEQKPAGRNPDHWSGRDPQCGLGAGKIRCRRQSGSALYRIDLSGAETDQRNSGSVRGLKHLPGRDNPGLNREAWRLDCRTKNLDVAIETHSQRDIQDDKQSQVADPAVFLQDIRDQGRGYGHECD